MTRCDNPAPHAPHAVKCEGVPTPPPATTPLPPVGRRETLHVMQASMQYDDTRRQKRADVVRLLWRSKSPDLVGVTEATAKSGLAGMFADRAPAAGYDWIPGPGGAGILVALRHKVVATGFDHVLDGYAGDPVTGRGAHGPRGILWVTIQTPANNLLTFAEFHNVTRAYATNERRTGKSIALLAAAIARVEAASKGRALAVLAADLNVDEDTDLGTDPRMPAALFAAAGITTVYDELRTYPNTHGGKTLDVIATVDRDRRVAASRVKVWRKGNSDHRRVSAWIDIAPTRLAPPPVA